MNDKQNEVKSDVISGRNPVSEAIRGNRPIDKILVAKGEKSGVVVFCIPVDKEIDLKKAAVVTGNKKLEMLHVKDLLATTGYIRGGCSPIGMKKKFPTFIDESAQNFEEITVSAGVRGAQLLLDPRELVKFIGANLCQIV